MTLSPDEFETDKVYRSEGESILMMSPYAISSLTFNAKGVLVNGYGLTSDEKSDALLLKVRIILVIFLKGYQLKI